MIKGLYVLIGFAVFIMFIMASPVLAALGAIMYGVVHL